MKIRLLLLAAFGFVKFSTAQINHHFPHANAVWGQFDGVYYDNPFSSDYYLGSSHFAAANGDSDLNGHMYIKVYPSDEAGSSYNLSPRLIREEGDQVYYFDPFIQLDTLLYDFSLQPGNEAHVYSDYQYSSLMVDSVGQIEIANELRKCIYFSEQSGYSAFDQLNYYGSDNSTVMWIEGIGSNDGLFAPAGGAYITDGIGFLTCFKENDTLKYGNECNLIYNGQQELKAVKNHLNIFPNPATSEIIVHADMPVPQKTAIIIYSIIGKELLRKEIPSGILLHEPMDLSAIAEGSYLVSIQSPELTQTEKIQIVRE